MDKTICWRGFPSDQKPVEVLRRRGAVLDDDGRLRDGYHETEVQAWAAILGAHEEAVTEATKAQQRALASYDGARRALIERRLVYRQVVDGYDTFRRAAARRAGLAV